MTYELECKVFHIASFRGHTEIVQLLLKHSKDINEVSEFEMIPNFLNSYLNIAKIMPKNKVKITTAM